MPASDAPSSSVLSLTFLSVIFMMAVTGAFSDDELGIDYGDGSGGGPVRSPSGQTEISLAYG